MLTNDFKNLIKHTTWDTYIWMYYIKYLPINNISKWSYRYHTCTEKRPRNLERFCIVVSLPVINKTVGRNQVYEVEGLISIALQSASSVRFIYIFLIMNEWCRRPKLQRSHSQTMWIT